MLAIARAISRAAFHMTFPAPDGIDCRHAQMAQMADYGAGLPNPSLVRRTNVCMQSMLLLLQANGRGDQDAQIVVRRKMGNVPRWPTQTPRWPRRQPRASCFPPIFPPFFCRGADEEAVDASEEGEEDEEEAAEHELEFRGVQWSGGRQRPCSGVSSSWAVGTLVLDA